MSSGDGPNRETPSGAGSASGGLDRPSDDEVAVDDTPDPDVDPPATDNPTASAPDAGLSPAAPAGDDDEDEPPASLGQSAVACTDDGGNCLIVNIAVTDVDADSCIQLALDNCEGSPQAGLRVSLPVSWRLGSASVNRSADDCVPGAQFNPQTGSTVISASGSIRWNLMTRVPSEMVLDVTLEPTRSAPDPTPVRITNSDLVDPLIECE